MFVLLPPSEGKAEARPGRPLDLGSLSFPTLTATRRALLTELAEVCAGPQPDALRILGLRPGQADALARNRELAGTAARSRRRSGSASSGPVGALPAGEVYTGVLYDALGLADLDAAARARAEDRLLIFSGLWGVLRIGDRIPPYRLSMGTRLPTAGPLAPCWRAPLSELLPRATAGRLILDLRSSAYAAAWRPSGAAADRTVTVRVLRAATRTVVSHTNKAAKGRLTRDLLTTAGGRTPATAKELVRLVADLGHRVEVSEPAGPGRPWQLDLLVPDL